MADQNTPVVTSEVEDIPRPANVAREPKEQGATGTLNFGGIISGEEYNPKLAPPACWDVYDEMRKSDGQVQASLEICKAPLSSATWTVKAPDDPSPQEQELADFCQRALFERGALADPWDYVLEHALMSLDFGCMAFEKVWVLGEDQKVRLHRLAPRMPRTIHRWNPDPNGQLASIEQQVWKDQTYKVVTIAAEDLATTTRKREGDNYWGISVLRTAYKDWFYKCQAEKADATRVYRYGVGIPIASRAKDYNYSEGEEAAVTATLKRMASHERSYIITHDGITWRILVPEGGHGGIAGITEKIAYHNRMLIRNVLADFMSDTADGLNSGRTRTLADVFTSCLYSTANRICGMLDLAVLRPLCVYNFPMKGLRFPTMVVNDVSDVDVKMISDILARLAALKIVTPDDDLETYLRALLDMPPMQDGSKGKSRDRSGKNPALDLERQERREPGDGEQKCPECKGSGLKPERAMGDPQGQEPCATCKGAGVVKTAPAPADPPAVDPAAATPATSLNGAQVTALLQILEKVATGQLPRDVGVRAIVTSFNIDQTAADELMGDVGKGFQPAPLPGEGEPPAPPRVVDDKTKARMLARGIALKRRKPVEFEGRLYARQPTDLELAIFSVRAVPDMLDKESEQLVNALTFLRKQQLQLIAKQVVKKDARQTTSEFTDLRPDDFTVPLKQDVIQAIKASILRVASFGAIEVRQELLRQGLPLDLKAPIGGERIVSEGGEVKLRWLPLERILFDVKTPAANKGAIRSALTTSAKMAGERETDSWFNSILETAIRLRNRGMQGDQLELALTSAFESSLDVGLKGLAKGEVNEAFALGRATEAEAHKDEISIVEYSCLLDANSCDNCAEIDGEEFPYGSERFYETMPPYKDCEGNKGRPDACRCVHLYRVKQ